MRSKLRVAAAATTLSLVGAVASMGSAHAAGVGTTTASTSLLRVQVGSSSNPLIGLRLLADDARSTIDPKVATPEAFSRLTALQLKTALPAPLNNINTPTVEARSPGGSPNQTTPGLNFGSAAPGLGLPVALPISLLSGGLDPSTLVATVKDGVAQSKVDSRLAGLNLVGGLIKADPFTSNLTGTSAGGAADGVRGVKVGAIKVDLGALLQGLGLSLPDLGIGAVSQILDTLNAVVAGLPTDVTLEAFTATLTNTAADLLETVAGADPTGTLSGLGLTTAVNGVLGTLGGAVTGVPALLSGDSLVSTVTALADQITDTLNSLLQTALSVLDGLDLISFDGVELGVVTKAVEKLSDSKADIVAKIGSVKVGNLALPGLDLGGALGTVSGLLNTITGTVSSVLGAISPDLADLVSLKIFDKVTDVRSVGGYNIAEAGVSALSLAINPPELLSSIINTVRGATGIGDLLSAANVPLPVLSNLMPSLGGLLDAALGVLADGAVVKVAEVASVSNFALAGAGGSIPVSNTPVAPGNQLPRTGGTAALLALGLFLGALGLGVRRWQTARVTA